MKKTANDSNAVIKQPVFKLVKGKQIGTRYTLNGEKYRVILRMKSEWREKLTRPGCKRCQSQKMLRLKFTASKQKKHLNKNSRSGKKLRSARTSTGKLM